MRTVGELWENNCEENLRIFWVNFENIRNFGKEFEKISHKFGKVSEYKKILIDLKNFKKIHRKFRKNIEKF